MENETKNETNHGLGFYTRQRQAAEPCILQSQDRDDTQTLASHWCCLVAGIQAFQPKGSINASVSLVYFLVLLPLSVLVLIQVHIEILDEKYMFQNSKETLVLPSSAQTWKKCLPA